MNLRTAIVLFAVLLLSAGAIAQPISITVNGLPTGSSITSGDQLTWQITLPSGGTSNNVLWVDVNQNDVVDVATDRMIFQFQQQDGNSGYDGPGDTDGIANGTITTQFPAGLAPARWLFVVSNGSSYDTASFQVNPLASPAATIVGHVSTPVGVDRSNFLIQAEASSGGGQMNPFWHALTDANGDYTIQLGGNPGSVNPWRVRLESSALGRLVPTRLDTTVNIGGSPPVVNFQLVLGTILTGRVVDQLGASLQGAYPHVHPSANPQGEGHIGGNTGPDGIYMFAVPPGSWLLHFTADGYRDSWWNGKMGSNDADPIVTTTQDSIKNLNGTLVKTGEIRGVVRNYGMPTNAMVYLFTMPSEMIMSSRSTNDDGSYSFNVDPGTYYVKFQKDGSTQYWNHTSMSPGQAINITGTETVNGIDGDFTVGPPPLPPAPQILKVWDVPFDNGGKVFVKFRGIEQFLPDGYGGGEIPFGVEKYTIWRFQKDGPVFVGEVPAAWDSTYIGIVPTLVDSNRVDPSIGLGPRWSRYMVKAHFLFNMYVIPSMPDSGYSLDNLAPNIPSGVGSAVSGGNVMVAWIPNAGEDLRYFSVYRGTTESFSTDGLTPVARTTDLSFTDVGAASGTYYYKVTATDFAGNESEPSAPVSSSGTSAVAGEGGVPSSFVLGQNYPNPFNPTTNVVYDVPVTGYVRIEVFNTLGQQVAELVAGEVMAGRHSVRFDATGLPTGLYIARMVAGEFTATRKINLVK